MSDTLEQRLAQLKATDLHDTLHHIRRGIEKESLRVTRDGELAQTPHPSQLGSAQAHPYITTDYSEALLEFITPAYQDIQHTLDMLGSIHRYTASQLEGERLWPASMPCRLHGDKSIPIARYGSSNIGQMKHIYRRGLEHRYGRIMQSIAGIHFNFSLPEAFWRRYQQLLGDTTDLQDFRSEQYFALIRNFRRYSWLLLYLFGASPALSRSFMNGKPHQLQSLGQDTLYLPYATSLRMSGLGYQNNVQSTLQICFNTLDNYITTLNHAIHTPHPPYEQIGVKVNGEYRQLNTNILQIENEYYSDIRPKRVTYPGEKPTQALKARGVEYIEVRNLDINPFLPLGIDAAQMRFLDAFLLLCLLQDSPVISDTECERIARNHTRIVERGREPGLQLETCSGELTQREWGLALCDRLKAVAHLLDNGDGAYLEAIEQQEAAVRDPELTPSARILALLQETGQDYIEFVQAQAERFDREFRTHPLDAETEHHFREQTETSLAEQRELEASDALGFDEFLRRYMEQQ